MLFMQQPLPLHLLCCPVLVPQTAGTGAPPVTMSWSELHLLSVDSGWARIMLFMSSLGWGLRSAQGGGGSGPGSGFRCSGKLRKGRKKDKGKDEWSEKKTNLIQKFYNWRKDGYFKFRNTEEVGTLNSWERLKATGTLLFTFLPQLANIGGGLVNGELARANAGGRERNK